MVSRRGKQVVGLWRRARRAQRAEPQRRAAREWTRKDSFDNASKVE